MPTRHDAGNRTAIRSGTHAPPGPERLAPTAAMRKADGRRRVAGDLHRHPQRRTMACDPPPASNR
uniref:hypothetical protein n=1 Tax=Komagataeibacter xylinus TaxID=28448 RepID=UPI000AFE03EC|nr:hypothetical protein [Komagataeibacter xylinus]